jgi:hypothetical protein
MIEDQVTKKARKFMDLPEEETPKKMLTIAQQEEERLLKEQDE